MNVILVNTCFEPKRGQAAISGLERMIARGCAAAWVAYTSQRSFWSIRRGEHVVLYENGRGFVAFGVATGEGWSTYTAKDRRRVDTDNDGEEHCQGVSWHAWVAAPTPGYRGIAHSPVTCCRRIVADAHWTEFQAHILKHAAPKTRA